ncbi:ADP-heptose--LPS heptosyltransferase [Rugosibacter aromaticivorans]|uniref:lipopolysaccharide heptosyltransferase II n=1 Tax=Rugosibacter aromaticivorans TaxID=1565605 RepID=A0A0C5J297_9PROT|nr:lipopolysaccharide heptosyltransferase II [Rugosibacter aromaticivorans]AJP49167.1 ADP-heptose--LPS heptosyltransferase [Rugosibacter aromaticivorans]
MKILVVAPSWIGDTVLSQPLLTLLKQQHPTARIEVLAPVWSAPLLARMAEVDATITSPFAHGEFSFWARRALGRRIRENSALAEFSHAYVLPNAWKSALVPFFAGIPHRIGYHGEARYGLLTERHRLDTSLHPQLAQRYAALIGPLPDTLPRPVLQSSPAQQGAVRRTLGLPEQSAPVIFCPGAEYGPAKRWPTWHFATLARRIVSPDTPVWLLGSGKDVTIGEQIVQASGGAAINLCGQTSLDQAIDLIATARAVVTNDSGLMHVAAALGRPLVALYGSSSPTYTPPLSPVAQIVRQNLPCSPCFKRECPLGHLDCLNGLKPDNVIKYLPS